MSTITPEAHLTDAAIKDKVEDKLGFRKKYVLPIIHDINNKINIIEIFGSWGSGKTSLINLLKKEIEDEYHNDIIISFDSFLDNFFTTSEIMAAFCQKIIDIYSKKKIGKKAIKAAKKLSSNLDISLQVGIPKVGTISLRKPPSSSKESKQSNEEHIEELNKVLEKRIIIFIDELDRLQANHILNFMIFTRALNTLKNAVIILGFDYQRVLDKLVNERSSGLPNYNLAMSYLDKFSQKRHVIDNDMRIGKFAENILSEISPKKDKYHQNNIFSEIIKIHIQDNFLTNIASYLATPRQLKKWIIFIKKYEPLLRWLFELYLTAIPENKDNLSASWPPQKPGEKVMSTIYLILDILAIFTKHPVIQDNLIFSSRIPFTEENRNIENLNTTKKGNDKIPEISLAMRAGIEPNNYMQSNGIVLVDSAGIFEIERLRELYKNEPLEEMCQTEIISTEKYDENDRKIMYLSYKILNEKSSSDIIEELLLIIEKNIEKINFLQKIKPNLIYDKKNAMTMNFSEKNLEIIINNLDKIWINFSKENTSYLQGTYQESFVKFFLGSIIKFEYENEGENEKIEEILQEKSICLYDLYIKTCLERKKLSMDENKSYDLDQLENEKEKQFIKKILLKFIALIKKKLNDDKISFFNEAGLLNIIYRFIHISNTIGEKNAQEYLSSNIMNFCRDMKKSLQYEETRVLLETALLFPVMAKRTPHWEELMLLNEEEKADFPGLLQEIIASIKPPLKEYCIVD